MCELLNDSAKLTSATIHTITLTLPESIRMSTLSLLLPQMPVGTSNGKGMLRLARAGNGEGEIGRVERIEVGVEGVGGQEGGGDREEEKVRGRRRGKWRGRELTDMIAWVDICYRFD